MDFRDFQDQRVKIYKNRKIKNCLLGMFSSRVIKKIKIFTQKKWKFCIFWRFSRSLGTGITYKSLFGNCLLAGGICLENRNHSWFFVRRPWILTRENMKNTFLVFSLLKFVTRYCSNSSDEKTLKFNKKHQLHRLSKQSRVFKKEGNPWKTSNIENNVKMPFKISQ